MSVMGKPVLYSYWRSSCSWRVRIALNLKEIPYDIKPVSLVKGGGEQHCNEFREVNPMEQVPALHIDNHTLIESLNILQYLEETRPHRPLMPADPVKRARVREICEVIASGIQPLQNLVVLIYVGEERKKEWAQHWITRGFTAVEKLLSSSAVISSFLPAVPPTITKQSTGVLKELNIGNFTSHMEEMGNVGEQAYGAPYFFETNDAALFKLLDIINALLYLS
ncbi:probable maleylacetoacetate isomerase 2 isoform X1 [Cephus cinctus]|uniref:maleylacetoacetate isomerase n=1 Tax=Cephus cinctus TaxID=211228 RepID=A0AAJ7RDI0_CEPCN|nr:probable maleylacetoacetate isomerase 2 isoform X1 [Cephus cinctus]